MFSQSMPKTLRPLNDIIEYQTMNIRYICLRGSTDGGIEHILKNYFMGGYRNCDMKGT